MRKGKFALYQYKDILRVFTVRIVLFHLPLTVVDVQGLDQSGGWNPLRVRTIVVGDETLFFLRIRFE